jgi:hypothetical protein
MSQLKDNFPHSLTSRADLLKLLDSALYVGSVRYARQIILTWLAYYPGDLEVRFKYCQLLIKARQPDQSSELLSELCLADPEYLDAWQMLASIQRKKQKLSINSEDAFFLADSQAAIHALGENAHSATPLPTWAENIRRCRNALLENDIDLAEELLHPMLIVDPLPPLIAVTHLQILSASTLPSQAVQDLAEFYNQRFPSTIAPILYLAESLMDGGESEKAVALIHHGATMDITGQVSQRIWGSNHPYVQIWPKRIEAPVDIPIPADVAAVFGWNQLPEQSSQSNFVSKSDFQENEIDLDEKSESIVQELTPMVVSQAINLGPPSEIIQANQKTSHPQPENQIPESLLSVQSELENVAIRINKENLVGKDGRFPIYLVFTTKGGLEKKYGKESFIAINEEMHRVVDQVAKRRDWGAMLVYADDESAMSAFGLSPAQATDPWSLKLSLVDIDTFLRTKGAMIGAVLIVGGPDIVPYHNLPNPVDDIDFEVPSDNPYSTRDENYFVPEWPIGRLPDGTQNNGSQLINMLQRISFHHAQISMQHNWIKRWWARIRRYFSFSPNGNESSWGYTAAIWRRASLSVFRTIGDPHSMFISPPIQVNGHKNGQFPAAKMGYFNLHGLEDSGNWYGQRDPSEPGVLPDYPVALRPKDIDDAPQIVFSEACYGAHIDGKDEEEALALTFLSSGSQTFTGSTCTSYGSITTPLIAADLLGHAYWKFIREGIPAGEALRRAKIHLAKEMHRRQGYLDGEDQKTLISFLLFGDPLAQLSNAPLNSKLVYREQLAPKIMTTVCDRNGDCQTEDSGVSLKDNPQIPRKTLAQVKVIVEQYLPGMSDANVKFSRANMSCDGTGHTCATSINGAKSETQKVFEHNIVTLSKHVEKSSPQTESGKIHHHYARLTIDNQGKVIKLAVSR